jgi:AraC-like DNA-binding protein
MHSPMILYGVHLCMLGSSAFSMTWPIRLYGTMPGMIRMCIDSSRGQLKDILVGTGDLLDDAVIKDDGSCRINVALSPYGVAIACVACDEGGHCQDVRPVILHINTSQPNDARRDECGSPRRDGAPLKDARFGELLSRLLIQAMEHGCTGRDPFIRHVTLALCAIAERNDVGVGIGMTGRPLHGGLTPWQEKLAKELLVKDLQKGPTLRDVAKACGLSVSHFGRAFKYSTGMPPHRWVLHQRLEMAKRLLEENVRSIAEIAGDCGFSEQSHLTHVFSRQFGVSPGAWRRSRRALGAT